MGKSYRQHLTGFRLFSTRIQLTNEQFVYINSCLSFLCCTILWVQKFQGFPIIPQRPEVVYKAKTYRLIRFLQRGSWPMEISSIMIWSIWGTKRRWDYDFHKLWYVKPWLKKADLALGDFEALVEYYLSGCSILFSMRRSASYQGCWMWCHGFGTQPYLGFRSRRGLFDRKGLWRCRHHFPVGVYTHEKRPELVIRKWMASRLLF